MRAIRLTAITAFLLLGLCGAASAFGLYVERLADTETNACPVCHRIIVPGTVHENAEATLTTEFGGALLTRGIPFTTDKGEARYLNVLVYRFQERRGGNFSVVRPASVGYHVHFFNQAGLMKVVVFDETQQALSENVFGFFTFLRRGARWITAEELAREGVDKALDDLATDLAPDRKAEGQ
jgi:hypothetical protein